MTTEEQTGNPTVDVAKQLFHENVEPQDEPATSEPASPQPLTKDDLVATLSAMKQPEKQEPSPEDIAKAMNVYELDDDTYRQFIGGDEDGKAAFASIRDGLIRQAATIANYLVEQRLRELEPIRQYVEQQRGEMEKRQFFEANKDLAGQEALVEAVRAQMIQEGTRYKTVEEAMKALAERSRNVLKSLGVKPASAGGTSDGTSPNDNRMASLSTGGSAVGGAVNGAGSKTAREIFG